VDALSTLLMVIIFVLLVFVVAQAFMTVTLNGRNKELDKATADISALSSALSLEQSTATSLQHAVAQLTQQLAQRSAERDRLEQALAAANQVIQTDAATKTQLQAQLTAATGKADATATALAASQQELAAIKAQIAELDHTVLVSKETLQAKLSDLAKLETEAKALAALRDLLEKQAQDAAARAMTEQERRAAVEKQLSDERKLGDSAKAQIALLNAQIDELKAQLSGIAATLELTEAKGKAKDAEIANLGQKLNVALAQKVEELQQYRSEFFGRLHTLLANRSGIQVVGDRFVFQSEILFPLGSADLTPAGVAEMTAIAITIKDIAAEIPKDVHWILRVDGHTDPQPLKGGAFASNWELSAARAITVVKLLIADGVPPDHLAATGFGEYQPLGVGDTPEAYARDRRIELRLTDR